MPLVFGAAMQPKDMGNWVATKWEGFVRPTDKASSHPTGVDLELLKKIGAKLCEVPEGWVAPQFCFLCKVKLEWTLESV